MCGFRRTGAPMSRNAGSNAEFVSEWIFVMNKPILFLLLVFACCLPHLAPAAEPAALAADRTEHDFGRVKIGETRKAAFTLTAAADVVVVLSASTNCECTKATWGRKPLYRGDNSVIEVSFEAREKGYFRKNILVRYMAGGNPSTLRLTVTGHVS